MYVWPEQLSFTVLHSPIPVMAGSGLTEYARDRMNQTILTLNIEQWPHSIGQSSLLAEAKVCV